MRFGIALLAGSILASAVIARADDSQEWQLTKPSGSVTELFQLYNQRIEGLPDYQQRLDATLELGLSNGTYAFKAVPWGWLRDPEAVGGNVQQAHVSGTLKEGWAERVSPYVDVRIGNQILAWGTADQINPTDIWNPRDYYDIFQSPKLPLTALVMKVHPPELDHVSLDVVATPFFSPSSLPISIPSSGTQSFTLSDSRWLLPFPTAVIANGTAFSAPLVYQVNSATYPSTWQAGARLRVTSIGGWDFSLSYANIVESLPRFAISAHGDYSNPSVPVDVTLNPVYFREQMIGLDGAGSISVGDSEIGARFEAAYFIRDNSRAYEAPQELQADLLRDNYLFAVAGLDYTFQHKILGTVLYANLQYVHYQRFGTLEQTPGQYVLDGLPDVLPWDRDLVLYWEDRIGRDARLKLVGTLVASIENGDGMVAPAIQYGWTDNLKTSIGGEFFVGNPSGFFGQYYENSRLNFGGSYSF